MRYKTLTVKLPEEAYSDLEAYALQEFPDTCRKCQGEGEVDGYVCDDCGGGGIKGNRSEAARYLLHFALGERTSPQARAMAAAYADIRSKWVSEMTRLTHRFEAEFKDELVQAMRRALSGG